MRGKDLNPDHTRLIVVWYRKLGSTRATAEHLRCSRGKVIRHLRAAREPIKPAGRPKS